MVRKISQAARTIISPETAAVIRCLAFPVPPEEVENIYSSPAKIMTRTAVSAARPIESRKTAGRYSRNVVRGLAGSWKVPGSGASKSGPSVLWAYARRAGAETVTIATKIVAITDSFIVSPVFIPIVSR
jgi:hypothetical protein